MHEWVGLAAIDQGVRDGVSYYYIYIYYICCCYELLVICVVRKESNSNRNYGW